MILQKRMRLEAEAADPTLARIARGEEHVAEFGRHVPRVASNRGHIEQYVARLWILDTMPGLVNGRHGRRRKLSANPVGWLEQGRLCTAIGRRQCGRQRGRGTSGDYDVKVTPLDGFR